MIQILYYCFKLQFIATNTYDPTIFLIIPDRIVFLYLYEYGLPINVYNQGSSMAQSSKSIKQEDVS